MLDIGINLLSSGVNDLVCQVISVIMNILVVENSHTKQCVC